MTNASDLLARLRNAGPGYQHHMDLIREAADTIDRLTSSGEAVGVTVKPLEEPKVHHIKDDAATRERIIREIEDAAESGALNWTEYPNSYAPDAFPGPFWDAQTPFGRYNIERERQDPETGHPITGEWWFFVRFNAEVVGSRSTLDAAQLLAEVDYASRLGFAQAAFAASPREGHVDVPVDVNTDAEWELEQRAFDAANHSDVPEWAQKTVADLWRHYCLATEANQGETKP